MLFQMHSPMSSSSSSSSLTAASGDVLIHRFAAAIPVTFGAGAVNAMIAKLENCRGEGEGTEKGRKGRR